MYGQSKIYEKFDNVNDYVFAFKNGVYDLKTNEFRNAKPNELITCTCKYTYCEPDKKTVDEINTLIESIMPNKDDRTFLMKTISLSLIGVNLLEQFYIWIGSGSNGKGVLRDLMMNTLGEYFDNMEIEWFAKTNHQGHAGAADPAMARKKNSRCVVSTEPEGDIVLRSAKLKQISGRDPIQVRELFKSSFNFVAKFKLFLQTNKEVGIDGADPAIVRRLLFIVFPNKFVDTPTLPNERPIDRTLKDRIRNEDRYKMAFFSVLLDYYKEFVKNDNNKLIVPERILKDTKDYLNINDPIQQYLDDLTEKTNNEKVFFPGLPKSFLVAQNLSFKLGRPAGFG